MSVLLQDLVQEKADSNRRIAEIVASESRRADDLTHLAGQAGTVRRRVTRAARVLTKKAQAQAAELAEIWQGVLELIEDGLEGSEAKKIVATVLELFDTWLDLAKLARDQWESVQKIGGVPDRLDELDEDERGVQRLQQAAAKLQAGLGRQRSAIDTAALVRAREELAVGRCWTPEEMLSRFRKSQQSSD